MTDILCNWLNYEVKLSKKVDTENFAKEFSSGYLVGEVLNKYELQNDFDQFSQSRVANAKLDNFTKLEPVLHLLEVPFDINIAHDMMTEKAGAATHLMYQVFISLNRKEKANLTGVAMETMRPSAPVKLEAIESGIYKERLKKMTPRQTDLNLNSLKARFQDKAIAFEKNAFRERFEQEERQQHEVKVQRNALIAKHKNRQAKTSKMLAKIQAANVHIPKPPPSRTADALIMQQKLRKKRAAETMKLDISSFEEKMKRTIPPSKPVSSEANETSDATEQLEMVRYLSNGEYIGKIRARLNEDASARAEREKRRRKVLVDQLKSHEAQEEARREEMLVNRLMRQSQQERRIAVQLLHTRHEKNVVRQNRILREKQYEEHRLKEFEDALNREAEMARLAKLEYMDQIEKDKELHDKMAKARAEEKYNRHYEICMNVLMGIIDFTSKIGEYRDLTNKLLPAKLMRDWTALFVSGQPLYDPGEEVPEVDEEQLNAQKVLEEERQNLLDEGDLTEYRNMIGEWCTPEDSDIIGPPRSNPIVGHIVQRLYNIVHPPTPPPPPPEFPPFPIKACILGKVFAGKSSCIKKLAENHMMQVLSVDILVAEAVDAHKTGEITDQEIEFHPRTSISTGNITITPAEPDNRETEEKPKDEEMEKGDLEKPVVEPSAQSIAVSVDILVKNPPATAASRVNSHLRNTRPSTKASSRAKLGAKANKFLRKGKPVDDQLTIDIIIDTIKRIPEDMGWVLDGFPCTYQQAKLLEKALTGLDPDVKPTGKSSKTSVLAPEPRPIPPPAEPGSGINIIILFDIDNELILKRSAGRTYDPVEEEQYHAEFRPPPDGSATGMGKQEKVIPIEDPAHNQEQVQQRLTTFQDQWPKLEKWFDKFGTIRTVDASNEAKTVYLEVEKILEDTLKKLRGEETDEFELLDLRDEVEEEEEKVEEPEKPPEPPVEEPPKEDVPRSRPSTGRGSHGAGSERRGSSRGSPKGDRSKSSSKNESGKKSAAEGKTTSRGASSKQGKSGKKGKTPEPEPEPSPEPPGTPLPVPGSDEWEFVDVAIADEMAQMLAPQWDMVEETYINSNKAVFRSIRLEREDIIRYFYKIRKDFRAYLKRPDFKQEFISAWQKDYNAVSDDLRDDEETRAELHERVDDLRERLWSMCDERKVEAEQNRENIIADGWLEDQLGLLANDYIMLAQDEVDRFQDTIRMLKDYYKAMEGKIPDELGQDLVRIPLVELPVEGRRNSQTGSTESAGTRPATPVEEVKSTTNKSRNSSGKKKKVVELVSDEPPPEAVGDKSEKRTHIPLVPRRPISPDNAVSQAVLKGGKPEKGKSSKVVEVLDVPPAPEDMDDRLIYNAYFAAITGIEKIIMAEQAAREAEEEAERQRELEREKEKEKAAAAAAKGKGGKGAKGGKKSRTPSPKKGKASPPPSTPPPKTEETEEEKLRKKMSELGRIEFFAAMEEEAVAAKLRLNLIRVVAYGVLADLRNKAAAAYTDMNDWLGARFLKEMESIDQLSAVMRNAIEKSVHIKEELVVHQENFIINEDVMMTSYKKDLKAIRSPTPDAHSVSVELGFPDTFTVSQIVNLYQQFALTAPTGVLSIKAFQETFMDLSALTHGTEQIPDIWMRLSTEKLDIMAAQLSPDGEYIDWRTLILSAAQPLPSMTQGNLLDTLRLFKDMDQKDTGYVTRQQYDRVNLWVMNDTLRTPVSPTQLVTFDRIASMKTIFFDIFANQDMDPPQIDYVEMLLYFSAAPDPYEGFLRALSVASATHMPRLPSKNHPKATQPLSEAGVEDISEADVNEEGLYEDIPSDAINAKVPLEGLDKVLHHGQSMRGDSHRFSVTADPEDAYSRDRLQSVYHDLGAEDEEPLLFTHLIEHPIIQDIISPLQTYKAVDLKLILLNPGPDTGEAPNVKIGDS